MNNNNNNDGSSLWKQNLKRIKVLFWQNSFEHLNSDPMENIKTKYLYI